MNQVIKTPKIKTKNLYFYYKIETISCDRIGYYKNSNMTFPTKEEAKNVTTRGYKKRGRKPTRLAPLPPWRESSIRAETIREERRRVAEKFRDAEKKGFRLRGYRANRAADEEAKGEAWLSTFDYIEKQRVEIEELRVEVAKQNDMVYNLTKALRSLACADGKTAMHFRFLE